MEENGTHAFPVSANKELPGHCRSWSTDRSRRERLLIFSFGFHFSVADFVLNFWSFYLWQRIKQGAINLWEIDLLF